MAAIPGASPGSSFPPGLQEPGVVELSDGTIFSWARTDAGAQYGSRSTDQGKTWSPPHRTELMSPESPASIKRLPHLSRLRIRLVPWSWLAVPVGQIGRFGAGP